MSLNLIGLNIYCFSNIRWLTKMKEYSVLLNGYIIAQTIHALDGAISDKNQQNYCLLAYDAHLNHL